MQEGRFRTDVELVEDYRFRVDFNSDMIEDVFLDEPPPLGSGEYPNAGKLIAAAVGNCLCASLAFCLRKSRMDLRSIRAEVHTIVERNERGRLRLTKMKVLIYPEIEDGTKLRRCADIFQDFCIATESVRQGIEVEVEVMPPDPARKDMR